MKPKRTWLPAVLLCCSLLAGLAAGASAAKHKVYFPSSCTNTKYKPKHVIVACGDAGLVVNGIKWTHYGQKTAQGSGTARTNLCTPSCAAGNFEKDPAAVSLFKPKLCKPLGIYLFTRLKVTYTSTRPTGVSKSVTAPFPCSMVEGGSG